MKLLPPSSVSTRRVFLRNVAASAGALALPGTPALTEASTNAEASTLAQQIADSRPSRLKSLPPDFNARIGTTHVAGKYHLTDKPFLVEGAEKMIELGTRLGKFWFDPSRAAKDYPFNSQWKPCQTLVELAQSDYFQQVFALPFATIILEVHCALEQGWEREQPPTFYAAITREFRELAAHLYRQFHDREVTFVLQNWEGDWMLRGSFGNWNPPPADWPQRCERMQKRMAARQAGVSEARAAAAAGAKCRVAHAIEVNRLADITKGIPTMTDKVLPGVEVDLVSYSAYDGMASGETLFRAIETIRKRARTGPLFGPGAVYLGEIGIPESDAPDRVTERWDELLGAALAAKALYVVQWELYCNELNPKLKPAPTPPVKDRSQVRGFWLLRPDGSLSETGTYFSSLWQRAKRQA